MDAHSFGSVSLNVGGHHYSTTRETLTQCPDSMLASMFSGRHHQPTDAQGNVFIDRDGVRFRHVLNYLRTGTLPSFDAAWRYEEVAEEADFFALEALKVLAESGAAQLWAADKERNRWTEEQRRQQVEWTEETKKWARQSQIPRGPQQQVPPAAAAVLVGNPQLPATPTPSAIREAPLTGDHNHRWQMDGNPQGGGGSGSQYLQTPQQPLPAGGNGFVGSALLNGEHPHVAASLSPNLNFTLEEEF